MTGATPRVLFLCTHNSARSQMAEGILRYVSRGAVEAQSAGTAPSTVHPLAVEAVRGLFGVDLGGQRSKHVDEFAGQHFDYVITLCDSARESCPVFPAAPVRLHWGFDDPSAVPGSEEDRSRAFRQTAAELKRRIDQLLAVILGTATPSPA
ncbi:MAG TPA: arsenate reductase ArsC [bacterium]|nr:arsenate reductase ArsC [bacterium]